MAKAFLLLFIVLAPSFVFAQSVVINEIAWMGSIVEGVDPSQHWRYEWLELYNNADTVGMLDGWMLELYRGRLDFRILLQGTIEPRGYFLIGASDKISGIDLNYKNLAGKFNNSGQRVLLKNNAGEIVDEIDATKGWPEGDNKTKQTMERTGIGRPGLTMQWQTSTNPGGTPKAQNSSGFIKNLEWEYPGDRSYIPTLSQEIKKDPDRSPRAEGRAALSIAFPAALLAGVLALGARRFLSRGQSRGVG